MSVEGFRHVTIEVECDTAAERAALWQYVFASMERYRAGLDHSSAAGELDPQGARDLLAAIDFIEPMLPREAVALVLNGLSRQVHATHPRHFGLFVPAPSTVAVVAETLAATFNPQLATREHSPYAVEAEKHVLEAMARRFGFPAEHTAATFTSGGAEANHTAMLCALNWRDRRVMTDGVAVLGAAPVVYVTRDTHPTVARAVRMCGLGDAAVREIPLDGSLRMDVTAAAEQVSRDRRAGRLPLMIVATAGTTSSGAVDPLADLGRLARQTGMWLHVDGAWGGAAALLPEMSSVFDGLEQADSFSLDAHKWLAFPLGMGMFFTRHKRLLTQTFRVVAPYLNTIQIDDPEPYEQSMQWSRRFSGLKLLLVLLVMGWSGYETLLRHHVQLGNGLRARLIERGWRIDNPAAVLPVVCFSDPNAVTEIEDEYHERLARAVVASGQAWLTTTLVGSRRVLRACVTSAHTQERDIDILADTLDAVRQGTHADRSTSPFCIDAGKRVLSGL